MWAWLRFSMWCAICSIISVPLFQDVSKSTSKPEESVVEGKSLVIFCLMIMRGKSMVANTRHWPNAGFMLGRHRRRRASINPALGLCLVALVTAPVLLVTHPVLLGSHILLHTRRQANNQSLDNYQQFCKRVIFWHRWCKSDHALSVIVFLMFLWKPCLVSHMQSVYYQLVLLSRRRLTYFGLSSFSIYPADHDYCRF